MKSLFLISLIILLFSCGETDNSDNNEVTALTDTAAVFQDSSNINQEQATYFYFEDYLQFNSREEIAEEFGEENLEDGSSWYAEGTVEIKHTILRRADNGHKIKFLWDQDNPSELSSIEAHYFDWDENFEIQGNQKVESKCGFYTGMDLKDLVKWNDEEITFYGFGWDYEGGVSYEENSKLAKCDTKIRLTHIDNSDDNKFLPLLGDVELNSSNELVQEANIVVEQLSVYKESL